MIYDVPSTETDSKLVYLPVPWEATVSYGSGTSLGPLEIEKASAQLDLFDLELGNVAQSGLHLLPQSEDLLQKSHLAQNLAQKVVEFNDAAARDEVNRLCEEMNQFVYEQSKRILKRDQLLGIIGGDHSSPLGALRAISEREKSFGILHFDAHSDTRAAYQGFQYSHASIMHNALEELPSLHQLTQIGIRDFCQEEFDYCAGKKDRVRIFFDQDLKNRVFEGASWKSLCQEFIADLPDRVWISFDIDGLDPKYCPHTGTPVPGGLSFDQANYVIASLSRSGRTILGFDLCEVASPPENQWDANVAMRLLYKLSGWTIRSQE